MDRKCSSCKRKTYLILKCRCEQMFCVEHIQSEHHVCGFDYKNTGREEIKNQNPKIKVAKFVSID